MIYTQVIKINSCTYTKKKKMIKFSLYRYETSYYQTVMYLPTEFMIFHISLVNDSKTNFLNHIFGGSITQCG